MFKLTKLITFRPDADPAARDRLSDALTSFADTSPHVLRARLQPAGEAVQNGGDLIWHVQFDRESAYLSAIRSREWSAVDAALTADAVSHVDSAAYPQGSFEIREPGLTGGIHRTLLISMLPGTASAKIAQFEAEMRQMARYLPGIRNWGFSQVVYASGIREWTHVWEQEFQDAAYLFGPYLNHPIHFASIDRWFDTQSHDWIVDPEICHTYCPTETSLLTPPGR